MRRIVLPLLLVSSLAIGAWAHETVKSLPRVPNPMEQVPYATLVQPGVRVGSIILGRLLPQTLPKLSSQDAAAGARYRRSLSSDDQNSLDIFTQYNDAGAEIVKEVRYASLIKSGPEGWKDIPHFPGYVLMPDNRTGSPVKLEARIGAKESGVRHAYPAAKFTATYFCERRQARITIWDDKASGIAFEFMDQKRPDQKAAETTCVGIIIHPKGKDVTPVAPEQFNDWVDARQL